MYVISNQSERSLGADAPRNNRRHPTHAPEGPALSSWFVSMLSWNSHHPTKREFTMSDNNLRIHFVWSTKNRQPSDGRPNTARFRSANRRQRPSRTTSQTKKNIIKRSRTKTNSWHYYASMQSNLMSDMFLNEPSSSSPNRFFLTPNRSTNVSTHHESTTRQHHPRDLPRVSALPARLFARHHFG